MALIREVSIDALGDDFAYVSGQWLSGARVAQHLRMAYRVWAFAAADEGETKALMDSVATAARRVIGIVPGARPEWDASERAAVAALLDMPVPEEAIAGLLLEIDAPDCRACARRNRKRGICGGCGATNEAGEALYACNDKTAPVKG